MEKAVKVKIVRAGTDTVREICLNPNESLYNAMIRCGIPVNGVCAGRGTCGKCRVKVSEGFLNITSADKKYFTDYELSLGFRLACMAYPERDCTVMVTTEEEKNFKVVSEGIDIKKGLTKDLSFAKNEKRYGITIDLGTTTLVIALIDSADGSILEKYTAANPQRVYGADVISRIKASNKGKGELLKSLIRRELSNGIRTLTYYRQIRLKDIENIVISGNTAMIHILMGYPCEGLGAYPFTPYKEGFIYSYSDELFDIAEKIPVIILPAISVFVGGDITAGLLACGFDKIDKPCLFIDLGTNGELALGNKEKILVTSASAGPAFEGGNISCGVGSIPGAICHVSLSGNNLKYETIDGLAPIGLCGSGVIDLTAQLLKEGIIDSTGLLTDEYFENGYCIDGIRFLQEDIRNVQLAKAAIRAGIEVLLKSYAISIDEVEQVFIAGGFGYHLDISKAAYIGLFPQSAVKKAKTLGNTALSGAVLASYDNGAINRLEHIISVSKEIHLSDDRDFNDLFIQYISFNIII